MATYILDLSGTDFNPLPSEAFYEFCKQHDAAIVRADNPILIENLIPQPRPRRQYLIVSIDSLLAREFEEEIKLESAILMYRRADQAILT